MINHFNHPLMRQAGDFWQADGRRERGRAWVASGLSSFVPADCTVNDFCVCFGVINVAVLEMNVSECNINSTPMSLLLTIRFP